MKKTTFTSAVYRLGITLSIIFSITAIGYGQSPYDSTELLIRFESGTSPGYIDSLQQEYNAVEDSTISPSPVSDIHLWRITFPTGGNNELNDINEVVGDARVRAEVQSAGLNYISKVFSFDYDGNTPDVIDPTYLCSNDFSITCDVAATPVKIAVLDTGIGYTLDLNDDPVFCMDSLFASFYGNYIGHDFVNQDDAPQDDHGHGTHIAGAIAEIATMAGDSSIQIESYKTHDAYGTGNIFDIIKGIDQSILKNVNIINMSFSYQAPFSNEIEPLEFVINLAGSYKILVVAAAGNDSHDNDIFGTPSFPASFSCSNIIAVASVNCDKGISAFSNIGGNRVDIATLGEDIIAPDHTGRLIAKSGTSQATAITSAVAGLLATNLTTIDWLPIRCSIINGAEYSPNLDGLMSTAGIVNAFTAFNEITGTCGTGYRSELITEEERKPVANEISVYPNPFSEYCNIKCTLKVADTVTLNVYDELGQLIFKNIHQLDKGTHILNWSPKQNLPNGLYFIRIQTNSKEFIKKIIKQH